MPSWEHALITRVADTGDWRIIRDRITPEHFTLVDTNPVWRFIIKHALSHGQAPSREIIRDRFPTFKFEASSDPPMAIAERLHAAHVYNVIQVETEKVMRAAADDPLSGGELLASAGSRMRTVLNQHNGNIGVDITKQMEEERHLYELRKNKKGLLGWAWPWEVLNKRTLGVEPGSLYAFYARPKTGKTFYLISLLVYLFYKYRVRIHLFGREMRTEQLRSRAVASLAQIDYDRYTHGMLTNPEERRWEEALEVISEMDGFMVDTAESNGADAADEMFDKAIDSGAQIIAVDGAYFFGERDWEIIGKFTSRFKYNLLNRYQVPGFMTSQAAKQKRAGGDDVGYGDSLLQDCDMLVKLIPDPDDAQRVHASTAGIRDGRPAKWQLWRRPCIDFGQAFEEPDEVGGGASGEPPKEVAA